MIRTHRRLEPLLFALLLSASVVVSGCGIVSTSAPAPTPEDFQGIAAEIVSRGIVIDHLVSGDAGCMDHTLIQTAIAFDAKGLGQDTPVPLHIYIFRDDDAYARLRSSIDDCVADYMTDASTFESIDDSPFVLAGQGPWSPAFEAALREALDVAAGAGD